MMRLKPNLPQVLLSTALALVLFRPGRSNDINEQLPRENQASFISQVASSPENALLGSGALINEFTGQAAFSVNLAGLFNHNGVGYGVSLRYYGGGLEAQENSNAEFSPTSWVGQGFSLSAPYIRTDHKGTRALFDDEYSIALDGISPVKLVASAANPDEFRILNNPGIKVVRIRGTSMARLYEENVPAPSQGSPLLPPLATVNPTGTDYFEYEVEYIKIWYVLFPNGVRYTFGDFGADGNTHCDGPANDVGVPLGSGNPYELCLPTVKEKVGFQPFYHQSHYTKMAHTWYLQKIQDLVREGDGGEFAIWFEYRKAQEWTKDQGNGEPHLNGRFGNFKLDRALYLKRIFSAVGYEKPQDPSQILQEVIFEPAAKDGPGEYYVPTWKNPDALYESEKLGEVTVKARNQVLRRFRLTYDLTLHGKTRLTGVFEKDPIFGTERPYYKFKYHETKPWQLELVTDAAGRTVEYAFGEVSIQSEGLTQEINLNTLGSGVPGVSGLEDPKINYRASFGDRYYLHVKDKDCADADQERLYEFRRQSTYWSLARVFLAPEGGCGKFDMAPDGSYFTYMFEGSIRVYNLDVPLEGTGPFVFDLMQNPSPYPPAATYTNADMDGFSITVSPDEKNPLGEILPFKDWFVYWNRIQSRNNIAEKKSIRFFIRNGSGSWSRCAFLGAFNGYLDNQSTNVQAQFREKCVDYKNPSEPERQPMTLEVRAGNDFIAVLRRNTLRTIYAQYQKPVILSVYYYDRKTGQIRLGGNDEFGDGKGIRKSIIQVALRGSGKKLWGTQNYSSSVMDCGDASEYDCENNFAYDVHDWNVTGNGFTFWHGAFDPQVSGPNGQDGQYVGHFAWDGLSLRYLKDEFNTGFDVNGRLDVFAGQGRFLEHWHTGSSFNHIRLSNLNPVRWAVSNMPDIQGISNEWTVKPAGDYLFLEKMIDQSNRAQPYQSAITNAAGATLYRHQNAVRAFKFFGNGANDIVEMSSGLVYDGTPLGNLMVSGDRLLGVRLVDEGGTFKTKEFVYGKLRAGAIGTGEPPQFDLSLVPPLPASDLYSCQLNGIDVVCAGFTDRGTGVANDRGAFNGKVSFYTEKNGVIAAPATATAVTGFTVRTKGAASNTQDGSQQSFVFDYSGASARLSNQGRVPNFPSVAKQNGLIRIRSTYAVDVLTDPMPLEDKTRQGALLEQRTTEGAISEPTTPTASDRRAGAEYLTEKITTSPEDGTALEKPAYFLRTLKTTTIENFFQNSTTRTNRFTFFDPFSGAPRIAVAQVGSKFSVQLTRFAHEFESTPSRPFGRPIQTASYLFVSDPCADSDDPVPEDPCSNLYRDNLAFFRDPPNQIRATASNIFLYDAFTKILKESYEWRPVALGTTPLQTLEGNLSVGTWRLVQQVQSLARDNPLSSSPHNQSSVVKANDRYASVFYGGLEGHVLASVSNADTLYAAFLSGEEELKAGGCAGCFGSFGRWKHGGTVLSADAVHSGRYALKVTGEFGPTINLRLGRRDDFLNRKKGFMLSAWMYATPNSQPAFSVEWRKNSDVLDPDPQGDEVTHDLDLVQAYVNENGPFPINRWVKVERLISYDDLMGHGIFSGYPGNEDYLRIWVGKSAGASTADPVYVDDVRLFPADASFSSQNYTLSGQVSSSLDARNEPVFTVFDAWQNPIAIRAKDGRVFSAGTQKLLTE